MSTNIYKGNTPGLYSLFLQKKPLQFSNNGGYSWQDVLAYTGYTSDIYRVSNIRYIFRVKPQKVITKAYMHYDTIEEMVQKGNFDSNPIEQLLFSNNSAMREHIELTFSDGILVNIAMKPENDNNDE